MEDSHHNVNYNISLAQFTFKVQLMDSYSTDYYDIAYPGLIMRVKLIFQKTDDKKRSNIKLKINIHFRCSISICIAKLLFLGEINSGHSISVFMICLRNVKF